MSNTGFIQMLIEWADGRATQRMIFDSVDTVKSALLNGCQTIGIEFDETSQKIVDFLGDDLLSEQGVVQLTSADGNTTVSLLTVELAGALIEQNADSVSDDPFIAYVLMRTDVPDYFGPKAQAQSHHAGTKMVFDALSSNNATLLSEMTEWEQEAGGFGTCIVLHASAAEMRQAVSLANLLGIHAGIVHDPTFPVRDGDRYTTLPIDTCAYVFGRKSVCKAVVGKFDLLRVS